jgi:nucleotide-binding universal stress UspA family protein
MKVLLATDGGRPASEALSLLERAASQETTQITVVTVAAPHLAGLGLTEPEEVSRVGPAGEIVQSSEDRLRAAGFNVEGRVLQGRPGAAILKEIDDGGFELTVLGAGNRSRVGRLLLGSVSTKVFHASPTSVLIVHRFSDAAGPIRVLFGTDGSKDAQLALEQITAFLDRASCQITVTSVAEQLMPQLSFPIPSVRYATSAPMPELEQEWIAAALEHARQATEKLSLAGFQAEAKALLGGPAQRLLAEADASRADIVVVGSRGLGAVERATMGSVSDQIAREAPATFVARQIVGRG